MSTSAPVRKRLDALTGLRFFAALGVVAFHNWPDNLSFPVAAWMHGYGFIGVPFFFILSGFVLAYSYLGRVEDRNTFYANRFARVYPVYMLAAVFAYLAQLATHREGVKSGLVTLVGAATLLQAWFGKFALHGNGVGWSLSAEAFFYALFPLLSLPLARLDRRKSWLLLGFCVVVAFIPQLLYIKSGHMAAFGNDDMLACIFKLNPLFHLPEFVTGICLYKIWETRRQETPAWFPLTLAAASLALLVALTASPIGLPWPLLFTGGLIVPLAGLIYALGTDNSPVSKFLGSAPLVLLGEASFALYLFHVEIHRSLATKIHAAWLPWATTILAIVVSILAHRFFEMPIRLKVLDHFRHRRETLRERLAEKTLESEPF